MQRRIVKTGMKTIYLIFNDREKSDVSTSLLEDLNFVFGGFVKIKVCFLSETAAGDIDDGDVFIVLYEDRVHSMSEYISSLDKVIAMTRTVRREFLPEVFAIPEGTEVLVINDTDESTLQTANNLYALGLNKLRLIPYLKGSGAEETGRIRYCITPDEMDMVPEHMEHVINIGNRCISIDTIMDITNMLHMNNPQVTRNIIKYSEIAAETNEGRNRHYVRERLKSEIFNSVFSDARRAIFVTDTDDKVVYVNQRAKELFFPYEGRRRDATWIFKGEYAKMLEPYSFKNALLTFDGINYIVEKRVVKIVDQVVGSYYLFEDERDIKETEHDLNKLLMKKGLVAKYTFSQIIGESDAMKDTVELAKKVAATDFTVLICGESGTGKELMAQSIHNFSGRNDQPFVAINCAALPETLLESELFGYEKGAFTGALGRGKLGLFEQAGRGTVFLDEIGDMPLNLQARLLRVLQEKQIMRLGSDKVINIDVRIIAATNKDLAEQVRAGTFREDLYYRLCNIPITMPPLRERGRDALLLAEYMLGEKYQELESGQLEQILRYNWPGNVRELKNAADYFATLGRLPDTVALCPVSRIPVEAGEKTAGRISADTDIRREILEIIAAHTAPSSGIGRLSVLRKLRERGRSISDDRLRHILKELEASGKISVGRGRCGCRIRETGEMRQ